MFELLMLLGFVGAGMSHWIAPQGDGRKTGSGEEKTPRRRARAGKALKDRSERRAARRPDEFRRRRFNLGKDGGKQPAAAAS